MPIHRSEGATTLNGQRPVYLVVKNGNEAPLAVYQDAERADRFIEVLNWRGKAHVHQMDMQTIERAPWPETGPTSVPLYSNSPEEIADNWNCVRCGNTTHFIGIDDHGYGGPDACSNSSKCQIGCECETVLIQPVYILHTGEVVPGLFFGGENDAQIGTYTRVYCGRCGQSIWEEGREAEAARQADLEDGIEPDAEESHRTPDEA